MSDAATPAAENGGTPPAVPAATPAPADVKPVDKQPEMVTLTKEAHDQLLRDSARASSNQRKADLYDRITNTGGQGRFKPSSQVTPPSDEELKAKAHDEDVKAERGLYALAADPNYREVLDKDPTLRDLLIKNPLAVLPILAPDALDADDAISLVKDALNSRKPAPAAAPASDPSKDVPPAPPAGGVNPSDNPVNEEVENARKIPNTEKAIQGMVGARLKGQTKK